MVKRYEDATFTPADLVDALVVLSSRHLLVDDRHDIVTLSLQQRFAEEAEVLLELIFIQPRRSESARCVHVRLPRHTRAPPGYPPAAIADTRQ